MDPPPPYKSGNYDPHLKSSATAKQFVPESLKSWNAFSNEDLKRENDKAIASDSTIAEREIR